MTEHSDLQSGGAQNEAYSSSANSAQGPFALYYGYHGVQREHPLRQYVSVFLKHWLMICGLGIIGLAWGAIVNSRAPRVYQSTALMKLGAFIPAEDGPTATLLQTETSDTFYSGSMIPLLKSHLIAKQVLASRPDIRNELNPQYEKLRKSKSSTPLRIPVSMLDQYLGYISFSQQEGTSLVKISAMTTSPAMAARIANAHAEAFIELVRKQLRATASINIGYLRRRIEEVSKNLQAKEAELREFSAKHSVVFAGSSGASVLSDKSRSLLLSLSETVQQRASVEGELRELQSSSFTKEARAETQPTFLRLRAAEGEYALLSKNAPYDPSLPKLKNEINVLNYALKQSGKIALRESTIKYRAVTEKERHLRDEFERLKNSQAEETSKELAYQLLQSERDALRETEKELRTRLDDAVITSGTDQQTVTMIDRAVASRSPIAVRDSANLMTGGLFGLLIGLAIAFSFALTNNTVLTVADLKRLTSLSVLGIIPSFGSRFMKPCPKVLAGPSATSRKSFSDQTGLTRVVEAGRKSFANLGDREYVDWDETENDVDPNRIVLLSAPLSRESEAFRHIRTTLRLSDEAGAPQTILVTSGQKNDGKTTVAANLAVSFAQSSSRVVLIDGDLRLPSVYQYFAQPRHGLGLRDYLAGECDLDSMLIESGIDNLQLILSGGSTSAPAELLSSPKMAELIDILKARYDHLVIDSPPVGHVTDALLLSPFAQAVTLVVRSGATPKPVAEFAVHRLRQVNAHIIGAVLNDVERSNSYREPEYYFIKSDYYYR